MINLKIHPDRLHGIDDRLFGQFLERARDAKIAIQSVVPQGIYRPMGKKVFPYRPPSGQALNAKRPSCDQKRGSWLHSGCIKCNQTPTKGCIRVLVLTVSHRSKNRLSYCLSTSYHDEYSCD